ncbi:hypothetical protein M426DRAFT_9095 [Hypoxylon sp. CI-4A]|nr:hypothetical protein M426DRAFT_9095 [Hypoxylon sp. CI-4A]
MYARLRSEQIPTPLKSTSPIRRKTDKRRLVLEEYEDDGPLPPLKRNKQDHRPVAHVFDNHRWQRADEENQAIIRRHKRLSPPFEPEQPLIKELNKRYAFLQATLHSSAISELEAAEKKLTAHAESEIDNNLEEGVKLQAKFNKLTAPLQNETVDYTATGSDGCERTVPVVIHEAIVAFEEKLDSTSAELNRLWEECGEVQAEIELLAEEVLGSRNGSDGTRRSDGRMAKGISASSSASASHEATMAEFRRGIDNMSKEVVEEMRQYEEEFLEEIENQTGNIMKSFLKRR